MKPFGCPYPAFEIVEESDYIIVTWINYKGKRILFGNFSGLSFKEVINVFSNVDSEFKKVTSKTRVLFNFTNK
jgi:hypothetical protein